MKRIIFISALVLSLAAAGLTDAAAQLRFGITGGATFSKLSKETLNTKNMTQYQAGLPMQVNLPRGFSIQPSLIYNVKGSKFSVPDGPGTADLSVGYVEVPVSIQWGPDLLLFRPFVDVTPYVGYGVNNRISASGMDTQKNVWDSYGINRWEYGLGAGIGLEIWKIQVIGRYNWNFGSLSDLKADGDLAAQLADVVIATSDNPRTEDPEFILSQVEEGVLPALHGNFHEKITDRRQAIFRAVELAQKDDIVLIAGKGAPQEFPYKQPVIVLVRSGHEVTHVKRGKSPSLPFCEGIKGPAHECK